MGDLLVNKDGVVDDGDGNRYWLGEHDPYDGKTGPILTVPVAQAVDDAERRRDGERVRTKRLRMRSVCLRRIRS